jgi:hypothetical protein
MEFPQTQEYPIMSYWKDSFWMQAGEPATFKRDFDGL